MSVFLKKLLYPAHEMLQYPQEYIVKYVATNHQRGLDSQDSQVDPQCIFNGLDPSISQPGQTLTIL